VTQFLATGRLFLSALAAISEEELEQLRPNLLPHEVTPNLETSTSYGLAFPTPEDNFSLPNRIDTQHSIESNEGNIIMFSNQPYVYNPDWDQFMTSDEDLDMSPSQRPTHYETSENGDVSVVMVDSHSVTWSLERDGDSLSPDSRATARLQFHGDSADLDTVRSLSPSFDSVTSSQCHSETMRARRAPDTTEFPSNPIAINIQSRSQSPVQIESPEAIDRAPSHYLRSFEALTSKYGENTNHNLKPNVHPCV